MNKLELVAIKKDGKYYVRDKNKYPRTFEDENKLRFNIPRMESFDDKWMVFEKLPLTAEWCVEGRHNIIGFTLKDEFEVTQRTPKRLPADAFENEDNVRGLYLAEFEKVPDAWVNADLDIVLIDEDCAPLINSKYKTVTDFPHYIDNHVTVWHKFPCHIEATDVFRYIVSAVKKAIPDHCFVSSDYSFSFVVSMRVPIIHEETEMVDESRLMAKKPKWVRRPLRELGIKVIDICTPGYDYGDVIETLRGVDYCDIEETLDHIIQGYIDLMLKRPIVCPKCKGYGWYEEESRVLSIKEENQIKQ